MSKLETLHKEVAHRKQEAYGILSDLYNNEQIKELCRCFKPSSLKDDLYRKKILGLPHKKISNNIKEKIVDITIYGTAALVSYMSLETKLPPPGKGCILRDEDMADIVLDATNAALCLIEAGWKPTEPLAILGKKFIDGPKGKGVDILGKIMKETFDDFKNQNNRIPTVRELWGAIPKNQYIQEKELLDSCPLNENREKAIYWRKPDGAEKKTTLKKFQDRYTSLKRS